MQDADLEAWIGLRNQLWPDCEREDCLADWESLRQGRDDCGQTCAVFVAEHEGRVVGFVEVTLRAYADGCESTPVGYLEGWYVETSVRRQGFGAALAQAAESWARQHGCREMASDTEDANRLSQEVHRRMGYEVVEVIVQFRKDLT